MTWTTIVIILGGIILKFLMSPPSALVGWIISKFELHPKLDSKDLTVTFNGNLIEEEEKMKFTKHFNEALFLERYNIFQGNEKLFLNPETDVIPYVIKVKREKKEMNLFVYSYEDHVDIVKQSKKKVASYKLRSEYLQKLTITNCIERKVNA